MLSRSWIAREEEGGFQLLSQENSSVKWCGGDLPVCDITVSPSHCSPAFNCHKLIHIHTSVKPFAGDRLSYICIEIIYLVWYCQHSSLPGPSVWQHFFLQTWEGVLPSGEESFFIVYLCLIHPDSEMFGTF